MIQLRERLFKNGTETCLIPKSILGLLSFQRLGQMTFCKPSFHKYELLHFSMSWHRKRSEWAVVVWLSW